QVEGETDAPKGQVMEETYENTSDRVRIMLDDEAKVVHIILNGIRNDIYSTMEACANDKKFVSRDEESLESYYTRLYKMMNEMVRNKLKVDGNGY
nr:hypothetical protein [Tanacetum cinerariifolium]